MTRLSGNTPDYGYDYTVQAWYMNGVYITCGHPEYMHCACYGKIHAGEPVQIDARYLTA